MTTVDYIPRSVVAEWIEELIIDGYEDQSTLAEALAAYEGEVSAWQRRLAILRGSPVQRRGGGYMLQRRVSVLTLDSMTTALDCPELWHTRFAGPFEEDPETFFATYEEGAGQAEPEPETSIVAGRKVGSRIKVLFRKDFRISVDRLREFNRLHWEEERSMRSLARQLVDEGVYSKWQSADEALRYGWERLGLRTRNRVDATRIASMTHGRLVGSKDHTKSFSKVVRAQYKRWHRREYGAWPSDGTEEERMERFLHLRENHDRNRAVAA